MDLETFYQQLPKIELHAHLNGSLSPQTLQELGCLPENIDQYHRLTKLLLRTDKTLDECFEIFKVAHRATTNPDSVYLATKRVIEEFYMDNVVYLELRTTPRHEEAVTKEEYIESVVRAILNNNNKIMVKLLLSIDRGHDLLVSEDCMKLIIKMHKKYPDVIKGVDLSGNPTVGYFNKNLFKQARDNGLHVTLHCGEVENNNEITEILDFNPDRIGHATFLHISNKNWALYKSKKIPLECCLTSNVVCGTCKDYKSHHLQLWLENQLPFTLATDDKGVFCTTLSKEYFLASENFALTPKKLWEISFNSIQYSFASAEEKQQLEKLLKNWASNKKL